MSWPEQVWTQKYEEKCPFCHCPRLNPGLPACYQGNYCTVHVVAFDNKLCLFDRKKYVAEAYLFTDFTM